MSRHSLNIKNIGMGSVLIFLPQYFLRKGSKLEQSVKNLQLSPVFSGDPFLTCQPFSFTLALFVILTNVLAYYLEDKIVNSSYLGCLTQ
jgi:hypothetical protein